MGIDSIANSGMQAAMTNMDIISNNIANAHTPGFKKSSANFADLFPSGNDASSVQIGLGVKATGAVQDFGPGSPTQVNVPSDISISGAGFFIMRDTNSGASIYTRNGQFTFDQVNGYFTIGNQRLQGFQAVNGTIPAGSTPQDLQVSTASVPAKATDSVKQSLLNLSSNDKVLSATFNPTDASTYNYSTSVTIYDSLGTQHTLNLYYLKTSSNNWTVNSYVDNTSIGTGSLTFNSNGTLATQTGLGSLSFSPTTGAASPQTFSVDMTGATQFGNNDSAGNFTQTGYSAGTFSGYNIDQNGMITASYTNNQAPTVVGKIAIAQFQSPQGLQNIGNMSWQSTTASGNPVVNQSNSQNNITPQSIESSNVDLAAEMVNLISAQNIFQANAQVEQTYNALMQTVTTKL